MRKTKNETAAAAQPAPKPDEAAGAAAVKPGTKPAAKGKTAEIGGPKGPEPTRFGDWERGGICIDF